MRFSMISLLCSSCLGVAILSVGCSRNANRMDVVQEAAKNQALPTFSDGVGLGMNVGGGRGGDRYDKIDENSFHSVRSEPLSTFSIDVDTASYANVRRFLTEGQLPPAGAVRIEEMVNYFSYDYSPPTNGEPFSTHVEVAGCPWNTANRLVRIGLQGKQITQEERPVANLVFLLDVSGSMHARDRLPLLKQGFVKLLEQLNSNDRVAIVVYAGASGLVLPATPASRRAEIRSAIEQLAAGGSTDGGAGIRLAYSVARENYIDGGVNRVLLATDGDFNVGTTSNDALVEMVEREAKSNVFLTVLGFGRGNLNDSMMEQISNRGNGNYAYIDSSREAERILAEQIGGTLVTIAQDVKIQVEFNPAEVNAYRLIGYENRLLAKEDFNNDQKDAGEIGAGHRVTALYEVVPADVVGHGSQRPPVDDLEYQQQPELSAKAREGELLALKVRYKQPEGDTSELLKVSCRDDGRSFNNASADFQFAAAVAEFGMLLRASKHKGNATLSTVLDHAVQGTGADVSGYRGEFVRLVQRARELRRDG